MTNTLLIPETAREYRYVWLAALVEQLLQPMTEIEYADMLRRIRRDGPDFARSDYARWQRRFRWIDLQLERGVLTTEQIVRQVIRDLLTVDLFRT